MKKPKSYLYPKLEEVLPFLPAFHKESLKDKEFKKLWKKERLKRLSQNKECAYCNTSFKNKTFAVIHHVKMPEKESELMLQRTEIALKLIWEKIKSDEASQQYAAQIDALMKYYKSLTDTDLICPSCHARQHSGIIAKSKGAQNKLF